MKSLFLIMLVTVFSISTNAQTAKSKTSPVKIENRVVDASCGGCNFGMKGKGCSLAVKIDGKRYWVEGASLDNYGDAHADHGMCTEVRRATVSGSIVKNKFVATSFKLLPVAPAK